MGFNKEFTDVIGPLYRYLLKQVGRRWDDVYKEISAELPKNSVQNNHIYTHIWQFVEKDVKIIDGKPYYKGSRFENIPITSNNQFNQLYINPNTGLLCKAKKGKDRYSYLYSELYSGSQTYIPGVKVYPGVQYHKLGGVWYEVKVRKFPRLATDGVDPTGFVGDKVLNRTYDNIGELKRVYGGYFIAQSKRRLTKKEIKFAGLDNKLTTPNKV
jgi:hypothetical protein